MFQFLRNQMKTNQLPTKQIYFDYKSYQSIVGKIGIDWGHPIAPFFE